MALLHAITGVNATAWGSEQQQAFNEVKEALIKKTALAQPDSEGEFVLDADASAVAISDNLHQWQGPPGHRRLRSIVYAARNQPRLKQNTVHPSLKCLLPTTLLLKTTVIYAYENSLGWWTPRLCHG